MKLNLYAVYDSKVAAYHNPFVARTDEEARSMIYQASFDKKTSLNMYPGDHTLFKIGTFDNFSGEIEDETKGNLGNVIELHARGKQQLTLDEILERAAKMEEPFEEHDGKD